MGKLKMNEIRSMTPDERAAKVSELRVELTKLRTMTKSRGKVKNPMALREIRRTIARILTVKAEEKQKE